MPNMSGSGFCQSSPFALVSVMIRGQAISYYCHWLLPNQTFLFFIRFGSVPARFEIVILTHPKQTTNVSQICQLSQTSNLKALQKNST
jgi:hypothetical protein